MSKKVISLFILLVTQFLVLQIMAELESEAPLPGLKPLEHDPQSGHKAEKKSVDQQVGVGSTESSSEGESTAEAPGIRRLGKHHSTDKSVAGGGVILGGLVTVTFAAVFCYIRVTRKRGSADY